VVVMVVVVVVVAVAVAVFSYREGLFTEEQIIYVKSVGYSLEVSHRCHVYNFQPINKSHI
jgi:hypothetical protein